MGASGAFARFVTGHARAVALAVLLATGAALAAIVDPATLRPRLRIDVSMESMLPEQDEERLLWERLQQVFGGDETLYLVVHRPEGVIERDSLAALARLTARLESIDGIARVRSLSNARQVRGADGELLVEPLLERVPESEADLARLRADALGSPVLVGNLISADACTAMLLLVLDPMPEAEFSRRGIDRQALAAAREEFGATAHAWLTGSASVRAETTRALIRDLTTLVPAAFLLMAAIAWVGLRSLRGMLLTVSTIGFAVVWTLGLAALVDPALNLVTVSVPSLILVVGFAYALHVVAAWQEELHAAATPGAPSPATRALAGMTLPTILTAGTTAAGFASLLTNEIEALREFGAWSAVGSLFTMVVALTWVPAVLELLPAPSPRPRRTASRRVDAFLAALGAFDVRHRNAIFAASALLGIAGLVPIPRIQINTALVSNFPEGSAVREAHDAANRLAGGAAELRLVLEADRKDAFKEPENLRVLEGLQEWLEEQPEVTGTMSLVDTVKLLGQAFHDGDPARHAIPDSKRMVSQLLFFGGGDEVKAFVDSQYRLTNSVVRNSAVDTKDTGDLIRRIEARLAGLPPHLRGSVTGSTALLARTSDEVAWGQATSMGSAFVVIWLFMSVLFTSLRIGLVSMIPNALPVLVYFGALGWTGITLNTTTGIVASMVLGIAVDDTIHLMSAYNAAAREKASEVEGVKAALRKVGRPVAFTSLALCLGFLVIGLSTLRAQAEFGVLAAFTLAVAWLMDMTLTPAIASRLRVVTLWDVLSLDLGEAPQRAIPLFRGLSTTQARVVALLTEIVSAPAGRRLIRAGERGDEVYVVIDGELVSFVERDGRRIELNRHGRGDLLGEVGLVQGERSADVECATGARLLRLAPADLARLERRYPRIAARLYRNLGATLAERLVRATERLVPPHQSDS